LWLSVCLAGSTPAADEDRDTTCLYYTELWALRSEWWI